MKSISIIIFGLFLNPDNPVNPVYFYSSSCGKLKLPDNHRNDLKGCKKPEQQIEDAAQISLQEPRPADGFRMVLPPSVGARPILPFLRIRASSPSRPHPRFSIRDGAIRTRARGRTLSVSPGPLGSVGGVDLLHAFRARRRGVFVRVVFPRERPVGGCDHLDFGAAGDLQAFVGVGHGGYYRPGGYPGKKRLCIYNLAGHGARHP